MVFIPARLYFCMVRGMRRNGCTRNLRERACWFVYRETTGTGIFHRGRRAGVFRQAGDFTGGAAVYARKFVGEIVPGVLERLTFAPTGKYLAGYSMAGLFALYSWLTGADWTGVVSCSGSVWFDGFLEWAEAQTPRATRLWLSVGNRERKTRNLRMQTVEEHTRRLAAHWQERMNVRFTLEQGGHFDDTGGAASQRNPLVYTTGYNRYVTGTQPVCNARWLRSKGRRTGNK